MSYKDLISANYCVEVLIYYKSLTIEICCIDIVEGYIDRTVGRRRSECGRCRRSNRCIILRICLGKIIDITLCKILNRTVGYKILISKKYFTNLYDSINKHLNEKGQPNRYSDVYYQAMGVLGPRNYFSIAGTLQKFGESITMNKSDFNKSGRYTTPAICLITSDIRSEWVDGYWFDANGLNSYKPLASWKGSGSQCWYEDTEGWYPTNQWQKINNSWYYFDENGYAAYNGYFNANGTWYYFGEDYKYEHVYGGSWREGYFLNEDGTQTYAPKAEWKSDSKGWWYEDASGWYATGVATIDGEEYYFTSDGYMACNGWYELGDDNGHYNTSWNHYDASGVRDGWGFYDESGEWVEEFFR